MASTIPTLSSVELNTTYTAHAENFISREVRDQFYTKNPTLMHLRKNAKTEQGGENLVCPVLEGHEPKGQSYAEGETVTMAHTNVATQARFQWAFYEEPIVIYHQAEQKCRGLDAKLDLVEQQTRACAKRLRRQLSTALFAASPTDEDIQGFLQMAPNDPTASGAYGVLNGAANNQEYWRNQITLTVGAFATNGIAAMRTMFNKCSQGEVEGRPTLIVMSQSGHEAYEALASAKQEVRALVTQSASVQQMADLGFDVLSFKGVPCVWDPSIADGDMLFLNDEAAQLVEMEGGAFTLFDFQQGIVNGLFARVTAMRWEGQLGCYERRAIGRLNGITY